MSQTVKVSEQLISIHVKTSIRSNKVVVEFGEPISQTDDDTGI